MVEEKSDRFRECLNCCIKQKCLKPVTDRKIRRELLILSHASKLPNLARLVAVALHPDFYESQQSPGQVPRMPSFVLQHAGPQTQFLCHPSPQKLSKNAKKAAKGGKNQMRKEQQKEKKSSDGPMCCSSLSPR